MDKRPVALTVKDENIIGFNVIEKNPNFNPDALEPEERKKMEVKNAAFMEMAIRRLLSMVPCECQNAEIIHRSMMVPRVMSGGAIRRPPEPKVLQTDVDMTKFSLAVDDVNGVHRSLRLIVAQCSRCGKTEISGDLGVIGSIFAEGVLRFANANPEIYWDGISEEKKEEEEKVGTYSLVDAETGERSDISSLGDLVGGSADGEVRAEDA